jgi:hypothetical protein
VRDGKRLDLNIADRKLGPSPKNSPVPILIQAAIEADGFGGKRIGIDRNPKFAAKNFEPANMISVLVGQQNAIEAFRGDAALLQAKNNLSCAQSAV